MIPPDPRHLLVDIQVVQAWRRCCCLCCLAKYSLVHSKQRSENVLTGGFQRHMILQSVLMGHRNRISCAPELLTTRKIDQHSN